MLEPIKMILDKDEKEITSGKCCVCGKEWNIEDYPRKSIKVKSRYLDGMPVDFSVQHMQSVNYCKYCNNVTVFERPFSDMYGVRDKCKEEGYIKILNSDEPIEIKRIKLAEYKFKDTVGNDFIMPIIQLYWYYDKINDIKQRDCYGDKLISFFNNNKDYIIKIKAHQLSAIKAESFNLYLHMILIDIYRRRRNFQKAIDLIKYGKELMYIKDEDIIEMKYYNYQLNLCNIKDSRRY